MSAHRYRAQHQLPPSPLDMMEPDFSAFGMHADELANWVASMPSTLGPATHTMAWQQDQHVNLTITTPRGQNSFTFQPFSGAPTAVRQPAVFMPHRPLQSPALSAHSSESVTVDVELPQHTPVGSPATRAELSHCTTLVGTQPDVEPASNRQNPVPRPPGGTSKFKGVTKHKHTHKWEAHLWDSAATRKGPSGCKSGRSRGKQVYLGGFDTEEDAARAYDQAALVYWGPSAKLNFSLSEYHADMPRLRSLNTEEIVQELRRQSASFARGASKFKGVMRDHHNRNKWEARTGRTKHSPYKFLGAFDTEHQAAAAYDHAALSELSKTQGTKGTKIITNFPARNYLDPVTKELLPLSDVLAVCDSWTLRGSTSPQDSPTRHPNSPTFTDLPLGVNPVLHTTQEHVIHETETGLLVEDDLFGLMEAEKRIDDELMEIFGDFTPAPAFDDIMH